MYRGSFTGRKIMSVVILTRLWRSMTLPLRELFGGILRLGGILFFFLFQYVGLPGILLKDEI
jgi:hypothetical protein